MGAKRDKRQARILEVGARFRVAPGTALRLPGDCDPGETVAVHHKRKGKGS